MLSSEVRKIFVGPKGANSLLFALVLLPNLVAAFLEGLSFAMILLSFTMIGGERSATTLSWLQMFPHVMTWVETLSSAQAFTLFISAAIGMQVMRSLFTYFGAIASIFLGTRMQMEAQQKVYNRILHFSFPFVSRYKVGELVEYTSTPATMIRLVMDELNKGVVSVLAILASLTVMCVLSPSLTLLAVGVFGCLGLFQKLVIRRVSQISQSVSLHLVEFNKHIVQSLYGLRAIYTFDRQKTVMANISTTLQHLGKSTKKLYLWTHASAPINEILGIMLVGIFLLIGQMQEKSAAALPLLLTFITIVYRMNNRLQQLLFSINTVAMNWGAILRLEEILSQKDKEFVSPSQEFFSGLKEGIVFDNVTLCYENGQTPAINTFSARIIKGSTTAFVGHSGAGKSSLVDLLIRLYEPSSGDIFIDGVNLQKFDLSSWRKKLGVVSQDAFIFHETIAENIRFGRLEASLEEIIDSAKMAGADEFITRLPQGYHTLVGERGYRLSGGERQRIALARALIRDPDILILDEATSSLDTQSERLIQEAIDKFRGIKTVILVAHRLSTIVAADRIFVLEKGAIIEHGTHEDLLKHEGAYARFWSLQVQQANYQFSHE